MSRPITPADIIGNIVVIIGAGIVVAWGADWVWSFFGRPFMLCATMSFMQAMFGQAISLILISLGLVVFFLSGMKRGEYLVLALGGFLLGNFTGVFAHYLGVSCN